MHSENILSSKEMIGYMKMCCIEYVNADSIDQLQTTIQHILSEEGNQAKRQTMVEEGYKQVDKFSWQEQAEKLLELTLEVANE